MNSYLISAVTLCLVAQCAVARQYGAGGHQQRKLAPSPQIYGQQQAGGYGNQDQYEMSSYEQHQPAAASYRAPTSSYEERTPAASYGASRAASYGKQAAGYGQQQQSYAAPKAAKYEEPYYPPMPFAWGYDINDGYGGAQYHKENGDEYGKRTGSYGYTDAYGVYRQVDYVADEHGFRATIKTNEPGTANESPADVELHAYEPPSNYYAGNQNSYAAAAPAKSYSSGAGSYGSSASSYGSSNSYSQAAPVAAAYSAPQQQYQAPAASYGNAQRSSYASKQSAGYGQQQAARGGYEQAAQYSSSVIVPVYQKAAQKVAPAVAVAAPAKRY